MQLSELLENIEVQGEAKVVYYDEEKNERVEVTDLAEVKDSEIKYVYPESDILYIEIEKVTAPGCSKTGGAK